MDAQYRMSACRTKKLKSLRLNYTCINPRFINGKKTYADTVNTIIICFWMIISVSLLALICSLLRHPSRHDMDEEHKHSIINITNNIESLDENPSKQEYEVETSSLSTLTSVTSQTVPQTNSSEYDNLIQLMSSYLDHQFPKKMP
ncbi:unnamed protein product [Adineta ricciae]|uniref:Uncharacterized protein n=1 Tax=Adineta ricciae TaxID=249248 RepID=A0A816AAN4_ADIRI|nr:unnamed protein product [Adineta ricciae]